MSFHKLKPTWVTGGTDVSFVYCQSFPPWRGQPITWHLTALVVFTQICSLNKWNFIACSLVSGFLLMALCVGLSMLLHAVIDYWLLLLYEISLHEVVLLDIWIDASLRLLQVLLHWIFKVCVFWWTYECISLGTIGVKWIGHRGLHIFRFGKLHLLKW